MPWSQLQTLRIAHPGHNYEMQTYPYSGQEIAMWTYSHLGQIFATWTIPPPGLNCGQRIFSECKEQADSRKVGDANAMKTGMMFQKHVVFRALHLLTSCRLFLDPVKSKPALT